MVSIDIYFIYGKYWEKRLFRRKQDGKAVNYDNYNNNYNII